MYCYRLQNEATFGDLMNQWRAQKKDDAHTAAHEAAVTLGRLGGKKGGPARAKKLTKAERRTIAQYAADVRWSKLPPNPLDKHPKKLSAKM